MLVSLKMRMTTYLFIHYFFIKLKKGKEKKVAEPQSWNHEFQAYPSKTLWTPEPQEKEYWEPLRSLNTYITKIQLTLSIMSYLQLPLGMSKKWVTIMPSCRRLVRATTCETNHGARLVVTPKPKVDQLY